MEKKELRELIRKAQQKDSAAINRLLQDSERPLFDFFITRTSDKATSEDLMQKTFLKIFKQLASLKEIDAYQGWVYTIARNQLKDWYREKQKSKRIVNIENMPLTEPPIALNNLIENQEEQKLAKAIDTLSNKQQEIILLRIRQQLPFKEIAQLLAIEEGNARVVYHKALNKIKETIAEDNNE